MSPSLFRFLPGRWPLSFSQPETEAGFRPSAELRVDEVAETS